MIQEVSPSARNLTLDRLRAKTEYLLKIYPVFQNELMGDPSHSIRFVSPDDGKELMVYGNTLCSSLSVETLLSCCSPKNMLPKVVAQKRKKSSGITLFWLLDLIVLQNISLQVFENMLPFVPQRHHCLSEQRFRLLFPFQERKRKPI